MSDIETAFDLTPYGTVALGSLVAELGNYQPSLNVEFDFGGVVPDSDALVNSSRGYYDHLAIGWCVIALGKFVTAGQMRARLQAAMHNSFMGYKGGVYTMTHETPVWVDNWGEWSRTAVIGSAVVDGALVLRTARVD